MALINQSTERKKTAPVMLVHTRYSEIFADVPGDMGHQAEGEKDLRRLERKVKKFRRMMEGTLDEHCDSDLYSLK